MKKILLVVSLTILFVTTSFAAVNINTASQAELESLQGIGAVKANAIIEHREKNGSFVAIDDLKKVNGIGSGTIEQLRDLVTVESDGAVTPAKQ